MTIRTKIKNIARRFANVPFVGRFIRIGVGVVRFPDYHSRQLPGMLHAIGDLNSRIQVLQKSTTEGLPLALQVMRREHFELRDSIATLDNLPSQFESVKQQAADNSASLQSMTGTVQYLLERMEFVRRELMFEMRYGGGAQKSPVQTEAVEPTVVATAKLEQARAASALRLNLGCGHVPLEGYLNVDRRQLPGVDVVSDLDNLPFGQGELDEIFSAHVLEHFPQEQLARQLLPYWLGLLKPGGRFAAVVPDAQGMIEAYMKGEYGFAQFRTVMLGGQDYDGDFHFAMFTPQSLSDLLKDAGFDDVAILASNRENGGCKEFEISARRPIQ